MYTVRSFGTAADPPNIGEYADPGTLTVGDAVRVDAANTLALASAAPPGSTRVVGFVRGITTGVATVLYSGELERYAGLTPGATYYLSDTGVTRTTITTTPPSAPSVIRKIGTAKNSTTLIVAIDDLGIPATSNLNMNPLATVGDDAPSGLTMAQTPEPVGPVRVTVNGIVRNVGDGITTEACYFGTAPGVAKTFANIVAGDEMYWNGTVATFDLAPADDVDFDYDV